MQMQKHQKIKKNEYIGRDHRGVDYYFMSVYEKRRFLKIWKTKYQRVLANEVEHYSNNTMGRHQEMFFRRINSVLGNHLRLIKTQKYYLYPVYAGATDLISSGVRVCFLKQKIPFSHKLIRWYLRVFKVRKTESFYIRF